MSVSLREDRQAIKKTKVGVIRSLYRGQGSSARKRGHHLPTYSPQQLIDWAMAEPKFHIIYDNWVKANYDRYLRPSFDRKDNKKSYTLDNLQVITFMENCRKGGTIEADPAVKSIYQKTKKGILIAQWRSAADAEKLLGIDNGDIGKCCLGKRKQAGGYLWEFTESSLIGKCATSTFSGEKCCCGQIEMSGDKTVIVVGKEVHCKTKPCYITDKPEPKPKDRIKEAKS